MKTETSSARTCLRFTVYFGIQVYSETSNGIDVHEDELCRNRLSTTANRRINYSLLKPAGKPLKCSWNDGFAFAKLFAGEQIIKKYLTRCFIGKFIIFTDIV